MKLDKKSVIQIVVLVVLVAGGAGIYLMQQDGGLNLGFITDLFESKPTVTRAPVAHAPAPQKPGAAAPVAANKPKADLPVIPATPASGQIHGQPFTVERSTIENGVLTLGMGKDVTSDLQVRLLLPGASWEAPAGKHYKAPGTAAAPAPQVMLLWREPGAAAPAEQTFTDKYTLSLEFGQEKDGRLPGKISLRLPDEAKTRIAGTFDADIRGFRLVNGKPDLGADSTGTLEYLALHELLKDDPGKALEVIGFRDGRYSPPASAGRNMTGYLEVHYRLGADPPVIQRFQFEKQAGEWKVARTLGADQLDEAHPLQIPSPKEAPEKYLAYLAARRLEADVHKKSAKQGIYEPVFTTRYSDKHKLGVCEASYKLAPDGETQKTAYLFRQRAGGWVLDRPLGASERVDFDTGRIAKR
jgi:hypothetical protein